MPYAMKTHRRVARRGAQLNGFTDILSTIAGDVKSVVSAVNTGAQKVDAVAKQVEAQTPNVLAIANNPTAAYKGATVAARAAGTTSSTWVMAAGVGLGALLLVKLLRS